MRELKKSDEEKKEMVLRMDDGLKEGKEDRRGEKEDAKGKEEGDERQSFVHLCA